MKQVYIVFCCLFFSGLVSSQTLTGSIQNLDEVIVLADKNLKEFSNSQTLVTLADSTITRSGASLTELLSLNSAIHFKENGLGMVSSPSFRGSTAQQTAVVWNGININSQFNGQTDFNTVNIRNFDEVGIRSGGGSVLYGSGAIGGSIHLNNSVQFHAGFENSFFTRLGSYDTQDLNYTGKFSNDKLSVNISTSYSHSENDYEVPTRVGRNQNGSFYNLGMSANIGYKINANNLIKYYGYSYDGERHFSLISPTETPTKYQDINTRQLLEWEGTYGKVSSNLKLAYLTERYKYFSNTELYNYTFGEANTVVGKYQLGYRIFGGAYLQGMADITHTAGEGSSINETKRTISGFSLLYKQRLKKLIYEASLRQEITSNYESPLLYNLGLRYKFNSWYTLKLNGSKNFRIPTYNDLYWTGSGNVTLKPEMAYQFELGNEFQFGEVKVSLLGFYNDITDMIRWLPSGSLWNPVNTDHVLTYGLETQLQFSKQIGDHHIGLNASYSYTKSENQETEKQLTYVPYHKGAGSVNYQFRQWSMYWQSMYTGEVFIFSDNNPRYILEDYFINNLGVEYQFHKPFPIQLGVQVKNILNETYQSVANRYMPGINYNFYLNFNF
ncbi:TonB-dependent siderophore receptor [Mangrovimonas sp. ST2L15]|uniref:TonB-dependent receptor plug domain-containing protein n=1 Tax=Mangrovimonas sp. ST2L15 TaxID=1645916 RepID=UPI0006B58D98|nr:TonB-dependent receptor [Mangrovimonas sp. ST2L15]